MHGPVTNPIGLALTAGALAAIVLAGSYSTWSGGEFDVDVGVYDGIDPPAGDEDRLEPRHRLRRSRLREPLRSRATVECASERGCDRRPVARRLQRR